MGAALSTTSTIANSAALIPDELGGELSYEKSLGSGSRFLKTIRAKHSKGLLVVKVFIKLDAGAGLTKIQRKLKLERAALSGCENVLSYQKSFESDRAGYILRQWVASNLYDRISTRPFLSSIEKKWIAYQLLTGLNQAHSKNVMHGDIKTENVLVTTHNWIYLTDFSTSFKPTFLPLNDPSTFSFFFDTSSRRTCYLAPERFYELDKRAMGGEVTKEMDIFSLGCVLAELWMEGTPIFTLSQLFKYREGSYNPDAYLNEIEDVEIRDMIKSMISLDPNSRSSCEEYLSKYKKVAFPTIFYDFLHPFISALNAQSLPITAAASTPPSPAPSPIPNRFATESISTQTNGERSVAKALSNSKNKSLNEADERIEKVWNVWEIIGNFLKEESGAEVGQIIVEESKESKGLFPLPINIPGQESHPTRGITQDRSALILLSLVCANIRNCNKPGSILKGIDILLGLNRYFSDETKLDRLVPYLVVLLSDELTPVRLGAMKALTQTLLLVKTLPPSNNLIFTEYIFPKLKLFSIDNEILIRCTYSECLPLLANCAKRFLEMGEALKMEGKFKFDGDAGMEGASETNYETSLAELHSIVQDHLYPLLSDPSTDVKRALLTQVASLCNFFGKTKSNDIILSHLITYLNTRDWRLRESFSKYSVEMIHFVGVKSLEEYILPLILLSLSDVEENVVVRVLESLTILAEWKLLSRAKIWELVTQITGFLCHPNIWIREGAASFLTCISNSLESTDRWCILFPTIKRLLRSDVKEITELSLLDNAREPLSRVIFEAAVTWAGKSSKSHFWSVPRTPVKGAPRDTAIRIDEDNLQMEKMKQLGMKQEDEYKLSMLRDYINKLASARQPASRTMENNLSNFTSASPAMQDLGVVPQTIFFGIKSVEAEKIPASRRPSMTKNTDPLGRKFSVESKMNAGLGLAEDLRKKLLESSAASSIDVEISPSLSIFTSTYDGDDPSIKQLLERIYLESYRQPLPEFGPFIPVGIPRRRSNRTSFPTKERTPTKPEGNLIANLIEHSGPITSIVVSPDQIFFATGSEDGTVKIWDTIRLEKNFNSKSRQTYLQGGKIIKLIMMENSRCVISCSDNGTVWIFRVEVNLVGSLPKYGKQAVVRQWRTDGDGEYVTCLISYNTETTSNLILGTSFSNINILDIRTMRLLQTLKNPIHFGSITASCVDKNRIWLIIGTANGVLSLWDLRFGLLLKSWNIGKGRIYQINLHPSKGKGKWIIVAAEGEEIESTKNHLITEVWDIEKGTIVEEFRVITASNVARNLHPTTYDLPEPAPDAASAIESLLSSPPTSNPIRMNDEGTEFIKTNPGVLTFLTGVDYSTTNEFNGTASGELVEIDGIVKKDNGFLITGGEDRKLRYWDLGRSSGSAVVTGLELEEDKPVFTMNSTSAKPTIYLEAPASVPSSSSRRLGVAPAKIHRSTLIANSQLQLRGHSSAAITALGLIDLPFRCVVTGDRSGVVKVWE